jgi:uncharacterized membrane protein
MKKCKNLNDKILNNIRFYVINLIIIDFILYKLNNINLLVY